MPDRWRKFFPLLAAFHGIVLWNWYDGAVRFSAPAINYFVVFLALICAWCLVSVVYAVPVKALRYLLVVPMGLWALCCTLLAPFVGFELGSIMVRGSDVSFERLSKQSFSGHVLAVYRTDGGATTSYGIVVRDEKSIAPGLLWVKTIYANYPAYDVTITPIDMNHLRFESVPVAGDSSPSDSRVMGWSGTQK